MKTILSKACGIFIAVLLNVAISGCNKDANTSAAPPTPNVNSVANRGLFGADACGKADRKSIPANAAFAVYFDQQGEQLDEAEILKGTTDDMMCPIYKSSSDIDPGICTPLCAKVLGKVTYCVPCT
jgi:hypothetical protein